MPVTILKNIRGSELPPSLLSKMQATSDQTFMLVPQSKGGKKERLERLFQTMDNISDEALKNGLTPEILNEILNEQ